MSSWDLLAGLTQGGQAMLKSYMDTSEKKKDRDLQMGLLKAEKGLIPKTDEAGNVIPGEYVKDTDFLANEVKQRRQDLQDKALLEGKSIDFEKRDMNYTPGYIAGQQEINKARLENDPVTRAIKGLQLEKSTRDLEDQKRGTPDERKAAGYAARLAQAEDVFSQLEGSGYKREEDRLAGFKSGLGKLIPGVKDANLGKQEQAENNFLNSVLRRESGASISPQERSSGEAQYFPRPGDTPEVLEQKKQNRALAIQNLSGEAGRAADGLIKPPGGLVKTGLIKPEEKKAVAPPKPGVVVDGYSFKGGDPSKPENWELSKKAGM